jgi:sigma-E factor negative regulatory protein RseA
MKEQISALMDGELDAEATADLLRSLPADVDLRCSWERWHLIRASLHQDLDVLAPAGLVAAVAERLQNEPTVLAPRRKPFFPDRNQWSRWISGAAIAASVAAVSVVGMRMMNEIPAAVPTGLLAQNVRPASGALMRTSDEKWGKPSAQVRNDLNQYLVEHSEFNPAARMNGMMSYVQIVGHDSEQ